MDLEFNCPTYVDFASESFQKSLNNYDTSGSANTGASCSANTDASCSANTSISSNQELIEDDLRDVVQENSSVDESGAEFVVHVVESVGPPPKGKKEVTVTKPFHFETDGRLKGNVASVEEEKDFVSQLRKHEAARSTVSGPTKIKAFNLTESKNKKVEGSYVPLAEQIKAYQKTPDRYHSSANREFQPQKHWSPPKLRPRTPKLQAVKRHRPVHALSREEQEAKEVEEMKAFEFHARPVDPRVYRPVVIEKREAKQSTRAADFELKTSQRSAAHRSIVEESHVAYEFHARPVPKSILQGPTDLGKKPEIKVTVPESPAFCTRKRVEKRKLMEEKHEEESLSKREKLEDKPKKPKKTKSRPKIVRPVGTEIKPFSFDQADKQRYNLRDKKIQERIEKENMPFVFKAQPLPALSVSLPHVEKKPITQPKPFNFVLDTRPLNHSVKEESASFSFKAQPAAVLKREPFIPEKPENHSIDIKEFDLNTEKRASVRLKQLEEKKAEELKNEEILLARKALEEEKYRREVLKLRQELVHKANPIPDYKVLEIKRSTKQLTKPISPDFETNRRLRGKEVTNN